jgi:hypothetical protein
MKNLFLIALLSSFASAQVFGHASAKLHFDDVKSVFAGYGDDKSFKALFRAVSGGLDNDLPKAFTNAIGPIPGNHRILGHGWTLNAAIPRATMEKLEERYPGKKKEIIDVWSQFARGCIEKSEELSGLPKKQANALASLIYDIHLIGDLEPDNKLIEPVLELGEIVKNIKKDCETLFLSKPQHSEFVSKKLDEIMKSKLPYQEKASLVMQTLYELRIGTMLHDTWRKTLKFAYSPDANVNARERIAKKVAAPVALETNAPAPVDSEKAESVKLYKVSSSGKIHNSSCQYYDGKGTLTETPSGENCKKCGGTKK